MLHISINTNYINKVNTDSMLYRQHYNEWTNVEVTADELFEIVQTDGFAINAQTTTGRVRDKDFKCTNLIAIDVDDGASIDEAKANPIYQKYGLGIYTSASYTPQKHKYRILFESDVMINDPAYLTIMRIVLNDIFDGDTKTTNPCRVFFGNNCDQFNAGDRNDKTFWESAQRELIDAYIQKLPEIVPSKEYTAKQHKLTDPEKQYIATNLLSKLAGYGDYFASIAALKREGYLYDEVESILTPSYTSPRGNKYELAREWKVIENRQGDNVVTLGTVWHILGGYPKFNRIETLKIKLHRTIK